MQVKKAHVEKSILAAARDEFVIHGFREANLRTIARRAGCSLSNLYNYFENKDDLFRSVLQPRLDEIKRGLELAREIQPPSGEYMHPLEEERKHHRVVIDYIDRHRQDLKLIFLQSQGSSLEGFSEYVIEQYQNMWGGFVGYLRENFPDLVQGKVSEFFIHNINSAYLNSIMEFLIHDTSHGDMLRFSDELTVYSYYGFVGLLER